MCRFTITRTSLCLTCNTKTHLCCPNPNQESLWHLNKGACSTQVTENKETPACFYNFIPKSGVLFHIAQSIQVSVSKHPTASFFFFFKKWWKIPLYKSTKKKKTNKRSRKKIKNLRLFLYFPAVHINVFPEAYSSSSSTTSSLSYCIPATNSNATPPPTGALLPSIPHTSIFVTADLQIWESRKPEILSFAIVWYTNEVVTLKICTAGKTNKLDYF